MIIKDTFELIKDMPNVFNYSDSVLQQATVDSNELLNMIRLLRLLENRISHFTTKKVFDSTNSEQKANKIFQIVSIEKYLLPVTYNKGNDKIILNLSALGVSEISRLDSKVVYSLVSYGLCFKDLVLKKTNLTEKYASPFINYLMTVLIRIFGKEFGLLGAYSTEIPKLKFLISTYVLVSFFGMKQSEAIKTSGSFARYDFNKVELQMKKYDLTNINDFILALSELRVMPGLSKYNFTAKILKFLSVNFLPALEDISRFICTILVSNIPGNSIIPSFIFSYNKSEFDKILEISKSTFK